MRDLSKLPLSPRRGRFLASRKLSRYFRLFIVVFVVGLVVMMVKSRAGGVAVNSSVVLKEASRGLKPVEVGDMATDLTKEAVNLKTEKINLEDIRYGGKAKAGAIRSYGGGLYILTVDAILPDPVNTNYEVWLVGGGEVIPIDFLRGSKTEWNLNIRSKDDYSAYDGIWITLERSKDEEPEEHIMEGSF